MSVIAETDVVEFFIGMHDVHYFCELCSALALRALIDGSQVRRHAELVESLCFHEVGQRIALFPLMRVLVQILRADEGVGDNGKDATNGVVQGAPFRSGNHRALHSRGI